MADFKNAPKTNVAPAAKPATPPAAIVHTGQPAASETALAKKTSVEELMAMVSIDERSETGNEEHEDQESFSGSPWLGYRGPKAKSKLLELEAAGIGANDGRFYVYDGSVIAPKPLYINFIAGYTCYTKLDDNNKVIGVSDILTEDLRAQKYYEHILGVVLVRLPGSTPMFVAATLSHRSGMVRAFEAIRDQVKAFDPKSGGDVKGREWKARGPKHAEAFDKAGWKAFAVRAMIWGKEKPNSDPKKPAYNLGMSTIEPTPVEDVLALNRYMGCIDNPESYPGECKKETGFAATLAAFIRRRADFVAAIANGGVPV